MAIEKVRERAARNAAARAARNRAAGAWRTVSIGDAFLATCARQPDDLALLEPGADLDFATLRDRVMRLAQGFESLGIRAGDGIAYQLPNWWEAAVTCLATLAVGAHVVPIVPILREREVGFILRQVEPRLLVVPEHYRSVDFVARAEVAMQSLLADRPRLVVVRGSPARAVADPPGAGAAPSGGTAKAARVIARPGAKSVDFAELLQGPPIERLPEVDPATLAAIIYTSGSTADPKGALHTHQTLLAEVTSLIEAHGLGPRDRVLMPSPLTHVSGLIHAILCPAILGTSAVLMERWDPAEALAAIERHEVTYLAGAPTFLQEMLAHPDIGSRDLSSLRLYTCGGASVPPELLRQSRAAIPGMVAKRSYGSSEFPTIATTTVADAALRGVDTEGRALPGVEIRIADEAGRSLPPGAEGEIRARGPDCFLGYADEDLDAESFDHDGYFRTGDLGILDADGYLRVTGRLKEIIVRKGEKISAREVEDVLLEMPGVAEVAVIPLADATTGERVCACVRLEVSAPQIDLEAAVAFLRARGLTPQKLPEQLECVDEFPRTPSGKIHKRMLRERIEALGARAR